MKNDGSATLTNRGLSKQRGITPCALCTPCDEMKNDGSTTLTNRRNEKFIYRLPFNI